jgi:hypothetical protein
MLKFFNPFTSGVPSWRSAIHCGLLAIAGAIAVFRAPLALVLVAMAIVFDHYFDLRAQADGS